jgi:protein involved in polysaccharide export with SLBB domain
MWSVIPILWRSLRSLLFYSQAALPRLPAFVKVRANIYRPDCPFVSIWIMRSSIITAFVALLSLVSPVSASAPELSAYRLNPGDVLLISVWKDEDLRREVVVLPDGTISFPLAGFVTAAGLTPAELQAALAQRIEPFIPDARNVISVSVQQALGNKIYVIGLVNKPGEFPMTQPRPCCKR